MFLQYEDILFLSHLVKSSFNNLEGESHLLPKLQKKVGKSSESRLFYIKLLFHFY